MQGLSKIDYAVICNDQNPEYRDLQYYLITRWNQLDIKVLYLDIHYTDNMELDIKGNGYFISKSSIDDIGNRFISICMPPPPKNEDHNILWRFFRTTILRFWIAGWDQFSDKTLIISDGDLIPINKKYIYCPSYDLKDDFESLISTGHIVTTCMYPNGNALATYTYGLGSSFKQLRWMYDHFVDLIRSAEDYAWSKGRMYMMEEEFLNHLYNNYPAMIKLDNRKWVEMCQEMTNLYYYQIELLQSWQDLCPFIEFHGMRTSLMTDEMWHKFFTLLEEYDEYDVTPPNWFWRTIHKQDRWRDTMITKEGGLILGDEYEKYGTILEQH